MKYEVTFKDDRHPEQVDADSLSWAEDAVTFSRVVPGLSPGVLISEPVLMLSSSMVLAVRWLDAPVESS